MIDHFTLTVGDLKRSIAFYTQALAPLGYRVTMDFGDFVGFGDDLKPYFFLKSGAAPTQAMHIAFVARDRAKVDAFHAAALGAGAKDDGAPGLREQYHPNYYGAFVIDPDGHPIEAVCHLPPGAAGAKPVQALDSGGNPVKRVKVEIARSKPSKSSASKSTKSKARSKPKSKPAKSGKRARS